MKPVVRWLTLLGALAWGTFETVASAQFGSGAPGGHFGSGGFGGGSPFGFHSAFPSSGSNSGFQGFSYSPYSYSSPSYGLLTPSFGGTGFGGTSFSPGFTVPIYRENAPYGGSGTPSFAGPSVHNSSFYSPSFGTGSAFGSDGLPSSSRRMSFYRSPSSRLGLERGRSAAPSRLISFYATGFSHAPPRKSPAGIDRW